jgi:two-component system sensor histidine kinase/response regulator
MATILIVDDEPVNRELLLAFLDQRGHTLIEAQTGHEALAQAKAHPPDLVLLDVMLPDIDGFEVTRRLRAQWTTEYLPIVLVTALQDRANLVRGLEAGADEFLRKPVDGRELMVRVGNLLRLRQREVELMQRNVQQMELQRFKDELSTMVVHDLRNPLAAVVANLGFLESEGSELDAYLREAIEDAAVASQRVLRLVQNLADLAHLEAQRLTLARSTLALAPLLEGVLAQHQMAMRSKQLEVHTAVDPRFELTADPELMPRLLESLVDNAVRHTPARGRIELSAELIDGDGDARARLRVGHSGPALPLEARPSLFEKYAQQSPLFAGTKLGLGLYFCRLVAEAHGGRIWLEESAELPTVFALELPMT